jgi:hypothetical protein
MPNSNYIKGRKKEYHVMNDERKLGNLVLRSAGSHSPIDVVSIDVSSRVIKFIQCKPDNISELDKNRLEQQMRELNNAFRCEFVLM